MKSIRHFNDFVLGLLMSCVSLYLILIKVTEKKVPTPQGGFLSRSDIWLKMIAVLLLVVSLILIIRSINFKKEESINKFCFHITSTEVCVIVSLILYALILPKLGFFISTFLITFYLVALFSVKEEGYNFSSVPKKRITNICIKGLITSGILLVVFWFIFGKLLAVQLPEFTIF
jgi:hypothetical protein